MKKNIKSNFDVSGLSIKDISKMNKSQLDSLSPKDLSKVTSRLVSAMNKRIRYLGKSEIGKLSPTYQAYERRIEKGLGREGFYSVKGKSRSELNNLFKQLSKSLTNKVELSTGNEVDLTTARGFKEYRKDVYNKLGVDLSQDIETERQFWELYRKYQEQDEEYSNTIKSDEGKKKHISDKILYYIANQFSSFNVTKNKFKLIKTILNNFI